MTVIQYEAPVPLPASRPGDELIEGPVGDVARLRAAAEYAGFIAGTEFVPAALRGNPAAIAAAMLAGAEVGLKPMAALRMVAVIQGRPTLTAEAQRGLVTGAGHELWFEESTVTRAIAAGRRRGSDRVGRVTWTLDDAKRAGISGGNNWQKYPAEMLRARASAALARAMFADVTLGIPASEELEGDTENGAVVLDPAPDAPPPKPARTRRRQPAAPAAGAAPAEPQPAQPVPPTPPPDDQPTPDIPPEPLATDAYKRRIFATMRDLGFAAGLDEPAARARRLAYVSKVVGRTIDSSNDLTISEAGQVIEQLDADKKARLAGEKAMLDELIATFDATPEPGGPQTPQDSGPATGEQPTAPEPGGDPGPPGEAEHAESGPADPPPDDDGFPEGF
jgi:hypothetical protein